MRVCFADTPCEEIVDCIRTAGDRICPSA